MELVFGYIAGLLTFINPCVLPILPIVVAGSLQAGRAGPAVLALGMSLVFVVLGVSVTAFGHLIGLDQAMIATVGAALMVIFGFVLLIPRLSDQFATATAGVAAKADASMAEQPRDTLRGQFVAGMLMGAVWSPCVGPTLGGAIAAASQGENLLWSTLIMTAFAAGVSTLILFFGYGARNLIARNRAAMRSVAERAKPVMGLVFVLVGAMLLLGVHHMIEAYAVENLPAWLIDFSTRY